MKKTLLFCGAILLFTAACKKNDDDNNNKTKTENLTTGNWYLRSSTFTMSIMGVDSTYDGMADMEACEKDNFYTFLGGGVAKMDEGATKCDASDPQTETGTWALLNNETKLAINGAGVTDTADILELNGSTLKLQATSSFMGFTLKNTMTFGH